MSRLNKLPYAPQPDLSEAHFFSGNKQGKKIAGTEGGKAAQNI
jgi:hypothetical protein